MRKSQIGSIALLTLVTFVVSGCSRVKDDWKAAQAADTNEAYQDFLRQHPDSEFGVAAQERVRQLAEDRDWQQAAKADTLDAYQQFVAAHADGKWAPEARVRIENFQLTGGGQAPGTAPGAEGAASAPASGGPTAVAATGAAAAGAAAAKPAAASAPKPKSASAAKPAAHGSTASGKSSGKHYAQLGAYSSKASAESAWHKLSGRFPTQLKSLQPHYSATTGAKPLVRLQVALPSSERVHQLCTELKQQSQPCIPLS